MTKKRHDCRIFAVDMKLANFHTVAVTHKNFSIKDLGKLHLEEKGLKERLSDLKQKLNLEELVYLSTCNRVELLFIAEAIPDKKFLAALFSRLNPDLKSGELKKFVDATDIYAGTAAVNHLLRVASSLESVVVGEREIITQFRQAYEKCQQYGLTGDFMRLLSKHTIETAKQVLTDTGISKNPVSVVSLAYRLLREKNVRDNARCIFVGAGQTNSTMAKYLKKHHFSSFTVFNRSLDKARELAKELDGKAYMLSDLKDYKKGFDVLVTCTGSKQPVITSEIFGTLLQGENDRKIIIDLAVPTDLQARVLKEFRIDYISVAGIKQQAKQNIALRRNEIKACEAIIYERAILFEDLLKERSIELAFGDIPRKIREINRLALDEVFAKDVQSLDAGSKETVEKIISYIEKKYNAVAITTAKKVFLSAKYE